MKREEAIDRLRRHEADLKRLETSDPEVFANAPEKFRFITKLYNAEFHILARNEIHSVAELNGKAVNVEHSGSQSDNVAVRVFGVLGVMAALGGLMLLPKWNAVPPTASPPAGVSQCR